MKETKTECWPGDCEAIATPHKLKPNCFWYQICLDLIPDYPCVSFQRKIANVCAQVSLDPCLCVNQIFLFLKPAAAQTITPSRSKSTDEASQKVVQVEQKKLEVTGYKLELCSMRVTRMHFRAIHFINLNLLAKIARRHQNACQHGSLCAWCNTSIDKQAIRWLFGYSWNWCNNLSYILSLQLESKRKEFPQ